MGVPVELFDAFRMVETDKLDATSADLLEQFKLQAVVALGLATMGSDSEAYSLEILPGSLAKKRAFWGETIWLGASIGLAQVGTFTIHEQVEANDAGRSKVSAHASRHVFLDLPSK